MFNLLYSPYSKHRSSNPQPPANVAFLELLEFVPEIRENYKKSTTLQILNEEEWKLPTTEIVFLRNRGKSPSSAPRKSFLICLFCYRPVS